MDVDRTAARLGVAVGTLPVVSMVVAASLLDVLTAGVLSRQQEATVVDTLLGPVLAANFLVLVGVLLVAPAVAFYLAVPEDRDAGPVAAGFAVGAVVYGAGVGAVAAVGGMESPLPGGHLRFGIWLALLFGGAAALGAVAADTVGPLFRPPADADGEHPRW